jgi:hypothetical protein
MNRRARRFAHVYFAGGRGRPGAMLLIVGVILLIIAIAGGAIVHPVLFALGIVALVLFFMGR